MERNRTVLLLAGAVGLLLLVCIAVIISGLRYLQGRQPVTPVPPEPITLCDEDPGHLCLVSFGSDITNHMVINLRLPDEDFPDFYAHLDYRDTSSLYDCQKIKKEPLSAYCTGDRAPLGETAVLRLYAVDDDRLLAEGAFAVAAIALPTFPASTAGPTPTFDEIGEATATEGLPLPPFPTSTLGLTPPRTPTRTPPPGYP